MAQYLTLIYGDENKWAGAGEAIQNEAMNGHMTFGESNKAAIRGGAALQPTATATSIRQDDAGNSTVTDGPFVETKEALGGYYVIEAADLDEALAIAKQVPAKFGGVEVRPLLVFD